MDSREKYKNSQRKLEPFYKSSQPFGEVFFPLDYFQQDRRVEHKVTLHLSNDINLELSHTEAQRIVDTLTALLKEYDNKESTLGD